MAEQEKIARRRFFGALGLAATAVAAVKISSDTVASEASTPAEPAGDGYRLTEHVKKYYRTTTI